MKNLKTRTKISRTLTSMNNGVENKLKKGNNVEMVSIFSFKQQLFLRASLIFHIVPFALMFFANTNDPLQLGLSLTAMMVSILATLVILDLIYLKKYHSDNVFTGQEELNGMGARGFIRKKYTKIRKIWGSKNPIHFINYFKWKIFIYNVNIVSLPFLIADLSRYFIVAIICSLSSLILIIIVQFFEFIEDRNKDKKQFLYKKVDLLIRWIGVEVMEILREENYIFDLEMLAEIMNDHEILIYSVNGENHSNIKLIYYLYNLRIKLSKGDFMWMERSRDDEKLIKEIEKIILGHYE